MLNTWLPPRELVAASSALLQENALLPGDGAAGGAWSWAEPLRVVLAVLAVALGLAAVLIVRRWRRERRAEQPQDVPPLVFSPDPGAHRLSTPPFEPRSPAPVVADPSAGDMAPPIPGTPAGLAAAPVSRWSSEAATEAHDEGAGGDANGTLQLLPGRLEPVNGPGREIRFVRLPQGNRFTIGRSPGPALSHIQLSIPTLSRMHAYMEYHDGRWLIGNLSGTNCVVVNGRALEGESSHWLAEGDQVELGQLVFVYRSR